MHLQELKKKTPAELLAYAEELGIDNAPTLKTQDLMFAILKQIAATETTLFGDGVLEVLSDGFGFLRSAQANYLLGRMTFTWRRIKSNGSGCARAIRLKAKFVRRKTVNGTLRCRKSTKSITWIRKNYGIA